MTENNLTPPPELEQEWLREWGTLGVRHADPVKSTSYVAVKAAQWGYLQAVKELENYLEQQYVA
jgi:hypothetical protein